MTTARMIELAVAILLMIAGVVFYRRRPNDGNRYGNQGAVLLLAIAVIIGIHAVGGLDYHPSQADADALKGGVR